jgi:DNA-binding NarL/FixJ family response regulator
MLLEALRPHLASAYAHVKARERMAALISSLEAGLEERGAAVIEIGRGGAIEHAGSAARELLDAYGLQAAGTAQLAPAFRRTLKEILRGGVVVLSGPRGRLRIRAFDLESGHGTCSLLVEERRSHPPGVESLRALGLTRRQAQVLRLLATGKQNEQIARELYISVATVRKHLEHIYARLGVSNRAQAIARVYA